MFDLSIENNGGVSWRSVMSWAERSWLLEVSKAKLSVAFAIMRNIKSLEGVRAILARFEGCETKQNRTQRQQPIDDLRKLSTAELLDI